MDEHSLEAFVKLVNEKLERSGIKTTIKTTKEYFPPIKGYGRRWTKQELRLIKNMAIRHRKNTKLSIYKAIRLLQEKMPYRTLESIRSKLWLARKELID